MNYLDLYQDSFPLCSPPLPLPYILTHKYVHTCDCVHVYNLWKLWISTLLDSLIPKFQMLLFTILHYLVSLGSLSILVLYLGNKYYSNNFPYITKSNYGNNEFIWKHRNLIFFFFLTCYSSIKHISCLTSNCKPLWLLLCTT